ncbi:glycosyltransferase family 2 protein [Aggregicoccus sp. 17bor-14]|uniref:glycosyltransferase family 2 protein n=1 Tax=Myxococcaceae TaxID=31 RepID=UPI00351A7A35
MIPTRNRHSLVVRAVQSVLAQSHPAVEAIVVVDGPDSATQQALGQIEDPRLRTKVLDQSVGGAQARNAGVDMAQGEWIAFLDDDDEWMPTKLERQLLLASQMDCRRPVVSCQVIARSPTGDQVWPRRKPEPGEPISEYLLARRSFTQGEGLLQTSTLLIPRVLLQKVPFRVGLRRHQDWDWMLRAAREPGVGIDLVMEPLAIWHIEERRATVSQGSNWKYSLEWISNNRELVTPWAFAAFVLTQVGSFAARERAWSSFWSLLRTASKHGSPRPIDLALYLTWWVAPQPLRRSLRDAALRLKERALPSRPRRS